MVLSQRAHDHVARPRNQGELAGADRIGTAGSPGEGPYVRIWLQTSDGIILKASYETNGCPSSIASGSGICELAIGREMEKMRLIDAHDLTVFLGGLPEGKGYYADLAVTAMLNALEAN